MKKILSAAMILTILMLQFTIALGETKTDEINLMFQGKAIACRPIAFTQNDVGEYILILYEEGLDEFVLSQKYSVTAPVYACILDEQGKPLTPNQIIWHKGITDCCYFFYQEEKMPESLSLIPLDNVEDTTTWHQLTLADIPSVVPDTYMLPSADWNSTSSQAQTE